MFLALSMVSLPYYEITDETKIFHCVLDEEKDIYPPNPSQNPDEDPRDPTINGTEQCKHTGVENCILCKANSTQCLCSDKKCYWPNPCIDCHGTNCFNTPLGPYCDKCIDAENMDLDTACKKCKVPTLDIIGDNCVTAGKCLETMPQLEYEDTSANPSITVTQFNITGMPKSNVYIYVTITLESFNKSGLGYALWPSEDNQLFVNTRIHGSMVINKFFTSILMNVGRNLIISNIRQKIDVTQTALPNSQQTNFNYLFQQGYAKVDSCQFLVSYKSTWPNAYTRGMYVDLVHLNYGESHFNNVKCQMKVDSKNDIYCIIWKVANEVGEGNVAYQSVFKQCLFVKDFIVREQTGIADQIWTNILYDTTTVAVQGTTETYFGLLWGNVYTFKMLKLSYFYDVTIKYTEKSSLLGYQLSYKNQGGILIIDNSCIKSTIAADLKCRNSGDYQLIESNITCT